MVLTSNLWRDMEWTLFGSQFSNMTTVYGLYNYECFIFCFKNKFKNSSSQYYDTSRKINFAYLAHRLTVAEKGYITCLINLTYIKLHLC